MRLPAPSVVCCAAIALVPLLVLGCDPRHRRPDDDDTTEPPVDDDDSAVPDDDDSGISDDDDDTWIPPEYLATYDFSLVMLANELSGVFAAFHGQMDVSTSSNAFLAEMQTDDGQEWEWMGDLVQNENSFDVDGWMRPPGVAGDVFVQVQGNFLGSVDGTPSESCLTGLGHDDDPNYPNQGVEFAWYGCQIGAPPAAIDRSGPHAVTATVHGDNCGAWSGTTNWTETWQFQGRNLLVTRGSYSAWGIVSDDGNIFRFSWLEQENPGRSLKVVGDFTAPTGKEEARATGYCFGNPFPEVAGGVLDLDY